LKEAQVNKSTAVLASIAVVSLGFAASPLLAEDPPPKVAAPMTFVQMAQKSPDGKLEKSRVMGAMERTFDMVDTRKEGKLDQKQARQFQEFLKQFTRESGA
jgi:hypothetical protein